MIIIKIYDLIYNDTKFKKIVSNIFDKIKSIN